MWDTDGDGVSDKDEVDAGSNPTNAASYLVSVSGALSYTGAQTGPVYALSTAGATTLTNMVTLAPTSGPYAFTNLDTLLTYTITAYRDSNTNGMLDTWEAFGVYTNNPITQPTNNVTGIDVDLSDPGVDTDGDGLRDFDEVYTHASDPHNADTDGDLMPDGWEFTNSVAVNLLVADGTNDFDADGLVNSNEYVASSNPNNVDTDGDSMWDGWEFLYPNAVNPTNPADAGLDVDLPQADGLSNSNEFIWGTNPQVWDTDLDTIPDGWETLYPNALHPTNSADGAEDYAGETNALGAIQLDGLVNSNEYVWGTSPEMYDTDGDGVGDGDEVDSGTDPTNSVSTPIDITGSLYNLTSPIVTGQVYVVLNTDTNGTQFGSFPQGVITNSPPLYPFVVSNVPNNQTYWLYSFIDVNSNATYDTWEPYGQPGTNSYPITPTNDTTVFLIFVRDSTLDTDGDWLSDYEEVHTYFTSPTNSDTDADSFNDSNEVHNIWATDPNNPASYPAAIGGSFSYGGTLTGPMSLVVSNSTVNWTQHGYTDPLFVTPTNFPTLSDYFVMGFLDENSNSVMDVWEPRGTAEFYPFNLSTNEYGVTITLYDAATDTDGDTLSDYDEAYLYGTSVYTNDTDGDGMPDPWEVQYTNAVDPNNPADALVDYAGETNRAGVVMPDGLINSNEFFWNTNPEMWDTDGDTLSDFDEVNTHGTSPTSADTDGDGMLDWWELLYTNACNPNNPADASVDYDDDGLTSLEEHNGVHQSNPENPDTDGDGLMDGSKLIGLVWTYGEDYYGTIPTNSDTDTDGFTDYEEIITIGSVATNTYDPVVVDDDDAADPLKGDPNVSYGSEDGHLRVTNALAWRESAPFDAIQEAVDEAHKRTTLWGHPFTVLVLDGIYVSTGNRDIDPGSSPITIRSRNGYGSTTNETGFGGGFVCTNGVGRDTVIQGFTIRTSVINLGNAGITCTNASPTIRECRFFDCGEAGVLCQDGAQPLVENCLFEQNAGAVKIIGSSPRIERSVMQLNLDGDGAGVWIAGASTAVVENCVIAYNTATNNGGGVYVSPGSDPIFINCTIAENTASNRGGGVFNAGTMHMWNSVLWSNTAPVGPGYSLDHAFEVDYSCLQTAYIGGLNNITSDPLFTGGGSFRLRSGSPCIDAGTTNIAGNAAPAIDIDGNLRKRLGAGHSEADIGAYEYIAGGSIAIQTPGGAAGETLIASLPTTVQWTWESGVSSNLTLEYTYDFLTGSPTWHEIATNVFRGTNGTGSYAWTVQQVNTSRCYLRMRDTADSQVSDVSSFEFAIADGIRLFAPNGGQTYYSGQTTDLSWASSVTTNAAVDLILSVDGGASYDTGGTAVALATGTTHVAGGTTNTIDWAIGPTDLSVLTTNGRVRVMTEDGSLMDESDAVFSVLGLIVTQPGGGGSVHTGNVSTIGWRTVGAGAAVDIHLSTNSGASYIVVTNGIGSADGANFYNWTVNGTPTSNAVLRIQSQSDTNIVGVSGEFKITDGLTVTGLDDLDGDGMSDAYEQDVGLDYLSGNGTDGALGDPDGDGFVNSDEMFAGTGPMDSASWIGIVSLDLAGQGGNQPAGANLLGTIHWTAVLGRRYRIEAAPAVRGPWAAASGAITADDTVMGWTDTSGAPPPRFYRIVVLPE